MQSSAGLRIVKSVDELQIPKGSFWYMASPYSKHANLDMAALDAMDVAGDLEHLGIPHFAPIPTLHDVARCAGVDPRCDEFWKEVLEPWLRRSYGCLVVMMDGWNESDGVTHERRVFTAFERPVLYMPKDFARRAVRGLIPNESAQ
jgi:hypothetical protein